MKNTILSFLLGIFVAISFAATTTNLLTVKPAQPKATVVVSGWATSELNANMKPYIQKGYIVKNMSAGDGARCVVLEKY